MLIIRNTKSKVAICTLWTKKELMEQMLDLDKVSVIGNLDSAKKEISFLLRNILSNPKIRYLVICWNYRFGNWQILVDLSKNRFKRVENVKRDYWQAVSKIESKIDAEIKEKVLEIFRKSVKIIDMRGEKLQKESIDIRSVIS